MPKKNKHNDGRTVAELRFWQSRPLSDKIQKTQETLENWVREFQKYTVRDWYTGAERVICCSVDDIATRITPDEDIVEQKNNVYISFSGGKDSTVLLHIARQMYPDIEAVFANTGLEFPEIQSFAKGFNNTTTIRPKMRFDEVIREYGYPFIGKEQADTISGAKANLREGVYSLRLMKLGVSIEEATKMGLQFPSEEMLKRYTASCNGSKFLIPKYKPLLFVDFDISPYCCNVMKKAPFHEFEKESGKKPITAQTAAESMTREAAWLKNGCNAFNAKRAISNPMSFWTEQDILRYIKENKIKIASVYGDIVYQTKDGLWYGDALIDCGGKLCATGCSRTGCIFCGFGAHREKGEGRFERLKRTHPKQYDYCMGGGAYDTDGKWKPTKDGLGMAHCIDELNRLYGAGFIKY